MTRSIAIVLALGGLCLGATACEGDEKSKAKGMSTAPATSAPATTTPSASAPTTGTSPTPEATTTDPKINNSRQIVLIDPEGKRYTSRTMAQLAAGMRATMGSKAPPNFCAQSYDEGVKGGGKFPAGRGAFMAACQEGWRLGADPSGRG